MTVRAAQAADAAAVAAIEALSFSDAWSEKDIESMIHASYTRCFVALVEDTVVGYLLTSFLPPEAEILRIAAHPDARRRGVGHALMGHFLSLAEEQGIHAVFLEVRSKGTAARALYRSHGFADIGVRPAYYRAPVDDAVLMRRDMPPHE
jgi:ribosomal-protein-alanine N-acetyltransferase